jgi:NitT/TauT family transport system substrate-binding protein
MTDASEARKPRRLLFTVIGTAIAVAVVFSVWRLYATRTSPATMRAVTIAQAGDFFLYAPLYIATDGGFFEKRGLKVSLVSTGGDEKTWAAVLSKSASFGIADPTFVAIAGARGEPGRVIASVVNGAPFWGITFKPIPVFTSPQDLGTYTVATFPAPSTAYTLQKEMFLRAGLKPKIRQGAFGTLEAILRADQADIALELEPNVSQQAEKGARVLYSMQSIYGDFAVTGLTATPDLLSEDPELAFNVVCGLQSALDFARERPDDALAILSHRFPEITPTVAKSAFTRVLNASIIPKTVVLRKAAWQNATALRIKAGDLKPTGNLDQYVDNQYGERAVKECRVKASA